MTNLLPCPFCGSKPTIFQGELYEIQCRECWRAGTWLCNTEAEAIEAWNTRAERTSPKDGIYAYEELGEIVRCGDCRWYENGTCYQPDGDVGLLCWEREPDGFCAWGERTPND